MSDVSAPTLRFGTRGSDLALWQTNEVIRRVRERWPGVTCTVTVFRTQGDDTLHVPLTEFTRQGIFTGELEAALLGGTIDVAVHSLKDLPLEETSGLTIGAMPVRADARDVLVARDRLKLAELPSGAVVGTCSIRRTAQLLALRPDLTIRPIRGTVESRVRQVMEGAYDATILAAAGLERLGRLGEASEIFDTDVLRPAPGQGVLAVQCRADDARTLSLLRAIDDPAVRAAAEYERGTFHALERKRILVTRSRPQAIVMGAVLARYGATPILCPTIKVEPVSDTSAVDDALRRLSRYDWLVLTSVNGVVHLWPRVEALGLDRSAFAGVRVAVVGPVTASVLAEMTGIQAERIPRDYVAEALADALGDVRGRSILLPRSIIARDALATILRERGATVDDIPLYRPVHDTPDERALAELRAGVDVAAFASASAVRYLRDVTGPEEWAAVERALVACIGPVTAAAARDAGLRVDVQAEEYTVDGMVRALIRHFHPEHPADVPRSDTSGAQDASANTGGKSSVAAPLARAGS